MQNEGGVIVTCRECGKMFLGLNGTEKTRQQFEDGHVVIGEMFECPYCGCKNWAKVAEGYKTEF